MSTDIQTLNPQTAANIAGGGLDWNLPNNAKVVDGSYSGATFLTSEVTTDELRLTNFGYTLPEGATLTGLTASITRMKQTAGDVTKVQDVQIQLICNGSNIGDNKSVSAEWNLNSLRVDVFYLFDEILTKEIIEDSTFGLSIKAIGFDRSIFAFGATASIDGVTFTFTSDVPDLETLNIPGPSGSEGIIGFTRETSWGTTPTDGTDPDKTISDIIFLPCKQETFSSTGFLVPGIEMMSGQRKLTKVKTNAADIRGNLRFVAGADSLGYLFTMLLGSPSTTELAGSSGTADGAYQHIWYNGLNSRSEYPAPYSIESQYAGLRSKLIQGAILTKFNIEINNNSPVIVIPEFIGKSMRWLHPTDDDAKGSGTLDKRGKTRPAVMTASPIILCEDYLHFTDIRAYPEINDDIYPTVLDLNISPGYANVSAIYTAGGGDEIGSYSVDNFHLQGKICLLFSDEELLEEFMEDQTFKLEFALRGSLIQGEYYNEFSFAALSCKGEPETANRVGTLAVDINFHALVDCATNQECSFTIINTVSSY